MEEEKSIKGSLTTNILECQNPSENNETLFKDDLDVVIKNEGFTNFNIEIKRIEADGGNYLANLFEITIKGQTKNGSKELNLFIKQKINIVLSTLSTKEAYTSESFAYNELFKVFKELEDEFNVSKNERYRYIKYYNTENEDVIIMENMAKQGFKVFDRYKCISLRYAELAIQEIAKFHALSFAIKTHRPEYYSKTIMNLKSPMIFNNDYMNFTKNTVSQALESIENFDKKIRLEKVIYDLVENLPQSFCGRENFVNCLCHNDYRVNNILCKKQNGEVTDVIPLDYQLMDVGSPLNDYFYLLLGSTDQKFRRQNMNYLKEYYYSNLTRFLYNFQLDINNVYPRNEFVKDYDKIILKYGLPITLILLPFVLAPKDDFPDFSKQAFDEINIVKHDLYIERLNEVLDDFIEWGFL